MKILQAFLPRLVLVFTMLVGFAACGASSTHAANGSSTMCRVVRGVRMACAAVQAYAPACDESAINAPNMAPEQEENQMNKTLTVGRAVHYFTEREHAIVAPSSGKDTGERELRLDPPQHAVCLRENSPTLCVYDGTSAVGTLVHGVPFSETPRAGHWSWPELVGDRAPRDAAPAKASPPRAAKAAPTKAAPKRKR